jgi:hypothetical protein
LAEREANNADFRRTRAKKMAAIVDSVVAFEEKGRKAEAIVRAGLETIFGGGGNGKAKKPDAKPLDRALIEKVLGKLLEAKRAIQVGLERTSGRSVRLKLLPDAEALAAALKSNGKDRIDLAMMDGAGAARAEAERNLEPLVVGGQSARQAREGIETSLVLPRNHPALKKLHLFPQVIAAKDETYSQLDGPIAERRKRDDASKEALIGNADIAGFGPIRGNDDALREKMKEEIKTVYAEVDRKWQAASGHPEIQKQWHERYLKKKASIERYYEDLIDRGALELTDQGMRKLIAELRCSPLSLPKGNRSHTLSYLERQVRHYGHNPAGYFAERALPKEADAYESLIPEKYDQEPELAGRSVTVADNVGMGLEQKHRPARSGSTSRGSTPQRPRASAMLSLRRRTAKIARSERSSA